MSSDIARAKLSRLAARLNARHPHAAHLPPLVLMTDDQRLPDPMAAARALPRQSMVVVRTHDAADRARLAEALLRLRRLTVIVAGDAALAARSGAHGLHLPEARIAEAPQWRARHPRWLITAALHGPRAAPSVSALDAVFLSPVFATHSHPERLALGNARASMLAARLPLSVYALGGVTAANAPLLHAFAGIAAIGELLV